MHTSRPHENLFDISKLPTLPQTLIELIDACNNHEVDIQTVGTIVGRDTAISARILQLANSAFLGSRTSFADTDQAVIYLGIDTVRNLAVSTAVHETFRTSPGPPGMSPARFWHHSLLTAVLAKSLAQLTGYPRPTEAYLAGLLHDLGKLLLNQAFPSQYQTIAIDCREAPETLEFQEKDRLGFSHSEAGGLLVSRWNLQAPIVKAIEQHHSGEDQGDPSLSLAAIIHLANCLSMSPSPEQSLFADLGHRVGIAPQILKACLEEAEEMVSVIAESMAIDIDRPEKLPAEAPGQDTGHQGLAERVRALSRLHGVLDNLVRAETPDRVFRVIEESLHILFNLDSCLILLPTTDGTGYSVHGSAGNALTVRAGETKVSCQEGERILRNCRESGKGFSIRKPAARATGTGMAMLFSLFDNPALLAVPLPGRNWCGFLVAALGEEQLPVAPNFADSLAFFARHAAARLHLEILCRNQAEDLAGVRFNAAQQVARSIAHEINNPLAIVQNYLTILGRRLAETPEIQQELQNIGEEANRIGTIVKQLDDLSGAPSPHAAMPLDLNALLGETLALFEKSLFAQRKISSHLVTDPLLPPIVSNPEVLRQILANLLKNAAEAVGPGSSVWLRSAFCQDPSQTCPDSVRILIEDNGPGIAPQLTGTLFNAGVSGKGEGHLGLGLAIVRKLLSELGGSISCSPRNAGGTCFTVHLKTKI